MRGSDVIVTAMGIVCAIGEDKDSFWHALSQAQCGIGPVDLFDVSDYRSRIGGQVKNVNFFSRLSARKGRRLGRCDKLGLWAAQEALTEAKVTEQDLAPERIAVVLGAG
ncbi:MAG: beta-ketoacyl synthase N-terminal-like domain-containing protein, partial [Syntrophobacterales bacterium]